MTVSATRANWSPAIEANSASQMARNSPSANTARKVARFGGSGASAAGKARSPVSATRPPICEPSLSEPLWLHGGAQNRQSQQSVPNTSRKDSRAARPRDARATARTCADLVTARPQPPGTQQNLGPPPLNLRLKKGGGGECGRGRERSRASGADRGTEANAYGEAI